MSEVSHLTDVDVNLQEDGLRIFVAQHVESWSYSDAGSAPVEAGQLVNKLRSYAKIIKTKIRNMSSCVTSFHNNTATLK